MLPSAIKQKSATVTGVTERYYPAVANTFSLVAMLSTTQSANKKLNKTEFFLFP
jgi:hypothetical protein